MHRYLLVVAVGLAPALISACDHQRTAAKPETPTRRTAAVVAKKIGSGTILATPYQDRLEQAVPFGMGSYFLSPWRAYMDTWPSSRLLNGIGCNFNVPPTEADAVATVMAAAGFRHARVEVGWGNMSYRHPGRLRVPAGVITVLQALKRHGIRPLILLNANSGYPVPIRWTPDTLAQNAAAGARAIFLKSTTGLKPGYSGLSGQAYQMGFPVITAIDAKTGRCVLSAPLAKAITKGPINIPTLKYQPMAEETFANGKPNPAAKQTLRGWMKYIKGICSTARQALGTKGKANAGFDLEVWNELTFGSEFLSIQNYYNPPLKFKGPTNQPAGDRWFLPGLSYRAHGLTSTGDEVLLPMTVDYVNNPANGLPGVKVIEGFSNTTPWANGAGRWPGQTGFSRHYYSGYDRQVISQTHPYINYPELVNAMGGLDRESGPLVRHAWGGLAALNSGKFFIPTFRMCQPEYWYYAYHTETVVRDLQPFPNPFKGHFRYANPGNGQATEVWMTECNFDRSGWAARLEKKAHVKATDPKLEAFMQYAAAKMDLRQFVFQNAKGLYAECMFAAQGGDNNLGILSDAFFADLGKSGGKLTPQAKAAVGIQIKVLTRLTKLMQSAHPPAVPCPLTVTKLVEHRPQLVFKGDGTPEHPNVYHRDDFACMPYQLGASRYAVGYYVVTRNVGHVWDKSAGLLDPKRYNMPPQTFDLTLGNIRGEGAVVSVYDPMTGTTLPVKKLARGRDWLTVRLPTVDYPRFLMIHESHPSPLILDPRLAIGGNGAATVSFATNVPPRNPMRPLVTWGEEPNRDRDGHAWLGYSASSRYSYTIPNLRTQAAVRVAISHKGLTARWPIWGYDVAGVNWPKRPNFAGGPGPRAEKVGIYVPPLPPNRRPFGIAGRPLMGVPVGKAPKPVMWSAMINGRRTMRIGHGINAVRATLCEEARPANVNDGVLEVLPELFATDHIPVFAVFRWDHAAAWCVHLTLDPKAHPLTNATSRIYYIAPAGMGLAVLSFSGTPAGMAAAMREIQRVQRAVHFSWTITQ